MPEQNGALSRIPDPDGYRGLMERMARRIGLDLNRLLLTRRLTASQVGLLKRRCSGCAEEADCARWLDGPGGAGPDPPRYCLNRKILMDLAGSRDPKAKTPPRGGGA